jgi:hypothetical protein
MSDKITTLNDPKAQAGRRNDQEPTPINARLQWMADLVCAILNAENIKRSSSMMKRPPGT